jgi:hypothetical protein
MLCEAAAVGGLLAPVGVGHGKTLVTLLLPDTLKSECAVLLLPAHMRDTLIQVEIPKYSKNFNLPKIPTVISYEELSSPNGKNLLNALKPDLIIADEAHHLRRKNTPRWRRLKRYVAEKPGTRCCFLSGSITTRSIKDYAHLSEMALRRGSPLPYSYHDLNDWAEVLDVDGQSSNPGALIKFNDTLRAGLSGIRKGFRTRLVETPGVIATGESALGTSLYIRGVAPEVPNIIRHALDDLRRTWSTPDEELTGVLELSTYTRQLACGFWYRWEWPNGIVDTDWLDARMHWNRFVRQYLQSHNTPGIDSPALLAAAVTQWAPESSAYRLLKNWVEQSTKPPPTTKAVWLDPFIVHFSQKWAQERISLGQRGIIWYDYETLGHALEVILGVPRYGASDLPPQLTSGQPNPVIICSRQAMGTGKNLQPWNYNLVLSPSSNGTIWEQLIGRTHRPGQLEDEVFVDVCLHTMENLQSWEHALKTAVYQQDTTGLPQKIIYASKINMGDF